MGEDNNGMRDGFHGRDQRPHAHIRASKICGIYSPEADAGCFDQLIPQLRATEHRHVPTEEPR